MNIKLHRNKNQKPVKIIEYKPESFTQRCKYLVSFDNLNIYTDSKKLHRGISKSINYRYKKNNNAEKKVVNFFYLTKKNSTKIKCFLEVDRMTGENAGTIYVTPDLSNFVFWGLDKLGTASGMIYGIKSFFDINNNYLGVHSSLLFNNKTQKTVILIGESKSGKSSIAYCLEKKHKHLDVISDDWNYIERRQDMLFTIPISNIYSPRDIKHTDKYTFLLESSNKRFYTKSIQSYNDKNYLLDSVVLLHTEKENLNNHELYLRNALHHIPFMPENNKDIIKNNSDYNNIVQRVFEKKKQLLAKYMDLLDMCRYKNFVNIISKNTLEEISDLVFKFISK